MIETSFSVLIEYNSYCSSNLNFGGYEAPKMYALPIPIGFPINLYFQIFSYMRNNKTPKEGESL